MSMAIMMEPSSWGFMKIPWARYLVGTHKMLKKYHKHTLQILGSVPDYCTETSLVIE